MALHHGPRPNGNSRLLLSRFSGAAAAYSLRLLSGFTGGTVVRVRRSSDNTEQDFTAKQIESGALETWVGAGNDGFVTTWYDQSGNGNDATQAAASRQPKIVDGGALVTENGKAAINFIQANSTSLNPTNSESFTTWSLFSYLHLTQNEYDSSYGTIFNRIIFHHTVSGGGIYYYDGSAEPRYNLLISKSNFTDLVVMASFIADPSDITSYLKGQLQRTTTPTGGTTILATSNIGGNFAGRTFDGYIHELVFYPSDQSASRTQIESNINDYYGIY